MANAYVSTTGSAAYPGTVNAPTSLGTALSTAAAGDVVYLAPGVYRGTFTLTVSGTSGNVITFIGDTTNSLAWTGASAGEVRITNYGSDTANPTAVTNGTLEATSRNYVTFQNLVFECYGSSFRSGAVYITSCTFFTFTACTFKGVVSQGLRINTTTTSNITINRCSAIITDTNFASLVFVQATTSTNYDVAITLNSCLAVRCGLFWLDHNGNSTSTTAGGYKVINSTSIGYDYGIRTYTTNTTHPSSITNCFIMGITGSMLNGTTAVVTQTYNVYFGGLTNIATSVTSSAVGVIPVNAGEVNMQAYGSLPIIAPYITSRLRTFGTASGAPATDLYNNAWSGITPDAGGLTYIQQGNSAYLPSERNASTITIAPGSTSQSIELYLGATGLTASTSGLSARYNRTRTASVSIPLVARTIAQAWTSGGFAEVDATNMPGVYRLDLPDAALAAGADDVTIVVRGASGTNGAVMTVKLSSGGLTSAQTASAVWGADPSPYTTATDFGGVLNETRSVVGSTEVLVQGLPQAVWDEPKSGHTTAGTYGDYLDAKVSTVADTARIQLRQGPFFIKQNATEGLITEVNQFLSTVPNMEMVLIDSSGGAVSVSGSTLVLRVRNQAGTAVVNNVTPTVAYADGGVIRWTPNQSWTALGVTTAGTYRIIVERTMGTTTTTFGPFLVQLSSG